LIEQAEQEASADAAEVRGDLRLVFPAAMGRRWLGPMSPELLALYPLLSVEVHYIERPMLGEAHLIPCAVYYNPVS
jgi:DNA-binding transcriptional LysR family regulator